MVAGTKRLEQKAQPDPSYPLPSAYTDLKDWVIRIPRNKKTGHTLLSRQPQPASSPVRETERGAHLCWKDNKTKQKHRQGHCPGPRVIFDFFKMTGLVVQTPFPAREPLFCTTISRSTFLRKLSSVGTQRNRCHKKRVLRPNQIRKQVVKFILSLKLPNRFLGGRFLSLLAVADCDGGL